VAVVGDLLDRLQALDPLDGRQRAEAHPPPTLVRPTGGAARVAGHDIVRTGTERHRASLPPRESEPASREGSPDSRAQASPQGR
jgi:hypothetical protein